jgi:hypothetical protein
LNWSFLMRYRTSTTVKTYDKNEIKVLIAVSESTMAKICSERFCV